MPPPANTERPRSARRHHHGAILADGTVLTLSLEAFRSLVHDHLAVTLPILRPYPSPPLPQASASA